MLRTNVKSQRVTSEGKNYLTMGAGEPLKSKTEAFLPVSRDIQFFFGGQESSSVAPACK